MGTATFPGVKCGRGVTLTTHRLPVPWSSKSRARVLPLWDVWPVKSLSACTTVHFTFTCTSTPLWTVQPVQSLSACTTVQFTLPIPLHPYWSYSLYRAWAPVQRCTSPLPIPLIPLGPYSLYRASVPVQRCTLLLPVPLIPMWAVRPVQSLIACTTVHFTFTCTSNTQVGRTACTEPQCLYNGALYLHIYPYSPMGRTACTEPQCL